MKCSATASFSSMGVFIIDEKLVMAAEIVSRDDHHHADTVVKKNIYKQIRVPRLWMVDPRYNNVEIYHSTKFGLALKGILAGSEILSPDFYEKNTSGSFA